MKCSLAATTTRLLLVLLLVPGLARSAEPPDVDALLARVQAAHTAQPALRAHFVQTSTGNSYFDPLVQEGTLWLQQPGAMRFDYSSPHERSYISDGKDLWLVEPAAKQATHYGGVEAGLRRFFGFLAGMKDVRRDFRLAVLSEGSEVHAGQATLELVPLQQDLSVDRVLVRVGAQDGVIRSVGLVTPFGDRTETVLSDLEFGPALPADKFTFAPPEGWQVVDAGGP